MTNNDNKYQCAFFNIMANDCAILVGQDERICRSRKCTFFKTYKEFEEMKNIDFLYESYKKGHITAERYIELTEKYRTNSKKKINKIMQNIN